MVSFSMFDWQRPITVLSLASYGMDLSFCGKDGRWWSELLVVLLDFFLSSGVTECTKLFLYFRLLFT